MITKANFSYELYCHLAQPESVAELYRQRFSVDLIPETDEGLRNVFQWVLGHYQTNGSAPPLLVLQEEFPRIDFEPPQVGLVYLTEHYRKRFRQQQLRDINRKLSVLIAEDPAAALTYGLHELDLLRSTTQQRYELELEDADRVVDDYTNRIKEGTSQGITFGFPEIDKALGGLRKLTFVIGRPKRYKAQPLDARVLTPKGWTVMGDIQVGDEVLNPEGGTSKVVGVFPQGIRDVYRAEFNDGSSTECDLDHLWLTNTRGKSSPGRPWKVRTLKECKERVESEGDIRVHVPVVSRLDFTSMDLPLHPYAMGLLLGDGCFRGNTPSFTTTDDSLLEGLVCHLPDCLRPVKNGSTYELSGQKGVPNPLTLLLKKLGLWGLYSSGKFVPEAYMTASHEDRLEMIRGLMDSDGCAFENGQATFVTTSPRLVMDFRALVQSVGGTASCHERIGQYRDKNGLMKQCERAFYMRVAMPPDGDPPFSLERKSVLWNRKRQVTRRMVRVTKLGRKEMQCIALDSDNQLYVTDDYIVTHNTWLLLKSAVAACKEGKRAVFFSLEMSEEEMFHRAMCMISGTPWNAFVNEHVSDPDRIRREMKSLEDLGNYLSIIRPPRGERNAYQLLRLAEERGADVVYIDQLKFIESSQGLSPATARWQIVEYVCEDLKDVSHKLPFYVACQFNREAANLNEMADLSKIGLSDSIGQTADMLLGIHSTKEMRALKVIEFGTIESRSFEDARWDLKVQLSDNSNFVVHKQKDESD